MAVPLLIINLLVGAVVFGGVAVLIGFILALILKKDRSKYIRNAFLVGLAIAVLSAGFSFSKDIGLIPRGNASAASISSAEAARIKEISQNVMNDESYLTPEIHREFWAILDKYYRTDAEIQKIRQLADIAAPYQRLFWADALTTVRTGKPVKSAERTEYERSLIKQGLMSQTSFDTYDAYLPKIVAGQPIDAQGEQVILTEDMINTVISQLDAKSQRLQTLFTRPTR